MEYGLIGEKLGHSFSKIIQEKLAGYSYELCPLSREEFPVFMTERNFKGINVTIPYKKEVIPYLDEIEEQAAAIGAVNTIVNRDGRLIGYNTDYFGFLYLLRANDINPAGKKVLVLGTGGACAAVKTAFVALGAREVLLVSRTKKEGVITYEEAATLHVDADIIANTTPVGMSPNVDASPIDLTPFTRCEAVVDAIYNPQMTRLTTQAVSLGMKGCAGLDMLVAQAKYACERFLDTELDDALIAPLSAQIAAEVFGKEA